ncbi:MAG: AGE family epimerase/isomerase [Burkholderiaceae bacterium]
MPTRGQNANMHLCEAMLAAFDATGRPIYLDRAEQLADHICIRQAALADGLVWEHYRDDWTVDWGLQPPRQVRHFRPWGFQPGHLAEQAKLLLLLDRRRPRADHLPRARHFFDVAINRAWDPIHGGLYYGLLPMAALATRTSTSGCANDPGEQPRAGVATALEDPSCGPLTTGYGTTSGSTSWTTTTAPGGSSESRQPENQQRKKPGGKSGLPHRRCLLGRT